tara:strand:+ start:792 stop:1502 length:711 start_codon:yes stop_codon:yes gene_type:complete
MKIMKIEKRIFWILALCVGYSLTALADNEINIEQTGDNLDLQIDQIGSSNIVQMLDNNSYINSSSLDIWIVQYNFGYENKIAIDEISGTGNSIKLAQGAGWDSDGWTTDGYESGGHYIEMDLYGNNNEIQWHQTNQTGSTDGHNFNLHIAGSDNSVIGRQQSDGVKEMELTIYNSFNDVLLRQKGNNATHSADIVLDGLYGTDFTLKQLGSTTQSYSISVDCLNPAGCSYNVQQGN